MGRVFVLIFFINLVIITGTHYIVNKKVELHAETYNLKSWEKPNYSISSRNYPRVHYECSDGSHIYGSCRDFAIPAYIAFYDEEGLKYINITNVDEKYYRSDEYIDYRQLNMFIRNNGNTVMITSFITLLIMLFGVFQAWNKRWNAHWFTIAALYTLIFVNFRPIIFHALPSTIILMIGLIIAIGGLYKIYYVGHGKSIWALKPEE